MTLDLEHNRAVAERSLKAIEQCLKDARLGRSVRAELTRNAEYERERIRLLDLEIARR